MYMDEKINEIKYSEEIYTGVTVENFKELWNENVLAVLERK